MPKVIAIDGPAGAGKSTVARRLAERIGYTYLDSGALYRAVTWFLLNRHSALIDRPDSPDTESALRQALTPLTIQMSDGRIWVGRDEVSERIRDMEVSRLVSMVSARRPVREKLLSIQRQVADRDIVAEGRDMGTVVFPSAFLKIYLDADVEIRSKRRLDELAGAGVSTDYREVSDNLRMRDDQDTRRSIAPLTRAPDAVYLDTTYLTSDDAVTVIQKLLWNKSSKWYELWKWMFYRFTWTVLKGLSRVYLGRRQVGADRVDGLKGPAILASNHASHLDPPLVAVSLRRPLHFFAKRELSRIPIFGSFTLWLSAIPVRRGILDRDALGQFRAALAAGGLVLIFPEGTRTRDGAIHDAKSGFGKLVLECGVPVVPVRIIGSFDSFPPGSFFPKPKKVRVIFGEPFSPVHIARHGQGRPASAGPAASPLASPAAGGPEADMDNRDLYDRVGRIVMDRIQSLAP